MNQCVSSDHFPITRFQFLKFLSNDNKRDNKRAIKTNNDAYCL